MVGLAIAIKESNKGKFTKYCKGLGKESVTIDCINKGKNSKSSSVRKRAVFAENANKWN
jgi:hypothetical protein